MKFDVIFHPVFSSVSEEEGKTEKDVEVGVTPQEDKPTTAVLGRLLAFAGEERKAIAFALFMKALTELAQLLIPLVLVRAYNTVVRNYAELHDPAVRSETKDQVLVSMVYVLALHTASHGFSFVSSCVLGVAGERLVARLRSNLFTHLLALEIGFYDTTKTGDLTSRLGSDTTTVQLALTMGLNDGAIGLAKTVVTITLMFIVSWELTSVVLGAGILTIFIVLPLLGKISVITKEYQNALARAAGISTETLGAMRTVRSFLGEPKESERYVKEIGDAKAWWPAKGEGDGSVYYHGRLKAVIFSAIAVIGFGMIIGAVHASLWFGFNLVIDGKLSFGQLTAFQSFQLHLGFGGAQLAGAVMKLAEAMGGASRLFELLDRTPLISGDGDEPDDLIVRGEVSFDEVDFAYPSRRDIPVLNGFTLKAPAEQTTALVGSSGSGKSTVVQLVLRFYDATGGVVALDGRDVTTLKPTWLRKHLALVQQEPVLFGMTVRDNVVYGLGANGTVPDGALIRVCKEANAHGFVSSFSEGYDTVCGERGIQLSGGQKQRLALARALIVDPRVLLLDEATSALDAESERVVQEALDRATVGRTVLVVAHRLSTVRDADQLAMVSRGSVIETGTHDVLLSRCDSYRNLVQRQT